MLTMNNPSPATANRFRFRAWHNGKMQNGLSREWLSNIPRPPDKWDVLDMNEWFAELQKAAILMQSTGLTDEEGSELFEHDIVECEEKTNVGRRTGRYVLCYFEEASEWVLVIVYGSPHIS